MAIIQKLYSTPGWGRTIGVCVCSFVVVVSIGKLRGVSTYRGYLLPRCNHQYGLRFETQFSRDLETARFEHGAAGWQSAALPQSYHASATFIIMFWKLFESFPFVFGNLFVSYISTDI